MAKNKPNSTKNRDLAKEILEAARYLFVTEGYEATSMRKIAARIGISATAIYLYYEDKASIIHALHQIGFEMLEQQFKTLLVVEDPFERLKAMGRTYINFALENPDFYEIMFVMKEPMKHVAKFEDNQFNETCWREGNAAFSALITNVKACQTKGYFTNYDAERLALLIWSNIHGLCTLKNDGRLELMAQETIGAIDILKEVEECFNMYTKMLARI